MKKCTLYVVTHKNINKIPERSIIGVGDNCNLITADFFDNQGDNISEKNKYFCELTAIYWIWKHDHSDYVGIEHYRRQFLYGNNLISKDEILSLLSRYDMIVSKNMNLSSSVYSAYANYNSEEELKIVRDIISRKYPEYLPAFDKMKYTNKFCVCNMMICNKSIFDDYCAWLFDILFDLEENIDISERTPTQQRMYGFLSERLLNVYIWKNKKLKIKHLEICEPKLERQTQKFSLVMECKFWVKFIINYKKQYR